MLEGKHYQNAYVTRDIDKALERFKGRADVRKVLTYEGTTAIRTPAGDGEQTNKLAFVWVEDLQFEFIQPIAGMVDLYRDGLPTDDGLKFHHICMRIPEWESFRARVDQQSFPIALEGGNDMLRFLYLDAREALGHYLEYTWMVEERWTQMGGR